MRETVERVMAYIHEVAYREIPDGWYEEFLEELTYELEHEAEEGLWPEEEEEE